MLFVFIRYLIFIVSLHQFEGKVVAVIDGDTIEVLEKGRAMRIRLFGIDCPERSQPYGTRAKQYTSDLVFGRNVRVIVRDIDRYGRSVADIYLADGTWINKKLIEAGLAWHYKRYSNNTELSQAEQKARKLRVGLWQDNRPIEPWNFRSQSR